MMQKEGQVRIPSGCAIAAVISRNGTGMTGEKIIEAMKPMHDRSNGLGGAAICILAMSITCDSRRPSTSHLSR